MVAFGLLWEKLRANEVGTGNKLVCFLCFSGVKPE